MATRKIKPAVKSSIVDVPFVESIQPESATPEETKAFTAYFDSLLANMPSWKRVLCAFTLSAISSFAVGYVGSTLAAYLTVGALVLGASTFLASIIYFLGLLVAFYASYRVGSFAYLKVIDKTVDAQFSRAKGWVTGMFASAPKGVTA